MVPKRKFLTPPKTLRKAIKVVLRQTQLLLLQFFAQTLGGASIKYLRKIFDLFYPLPPVRI